MLISLELVTGMRHKRKVMCNGEQKLNVRQLHDRLKMCCFDWLVIVLIGLCCKCVVLIGRRHYNKKHKDVLKKKVLTFAFLGMVLFMSI